MVCRFLVTVRIRRACGPPRVRAFVVQFPGSAGRWSARAAQAVVALVLMLTRNPRRGPQPHPRRPGPPLRIASSLATAVMEESSTIFPNIGRILVSKVI